MHYKNKFQIIRIAPNDDGDDDEEEALSTFNLAIIHSSANDGKNFNRTSLAYRLGWMKNISRHRIKINRFSCLRIKFKEIFPLKMNENIKITCSCITISLTLPFYYYFLKTAAASLEALPSTVRRQVHVVYNTHSCSPRDSHHVHFNLLSI